MVRTCSQWSCWFALLLVTASGCGKALVFNDLVEGTVKLDGKPLGNVHVQFEGFSLRELHGPNDLLRRAKGEPRHEAVAGRRGGPLFSRRRSRIAGRSATGRRRHGLTVSP